MSLTVFWFRRDLRIEDNAGLMHALKNQNSPVKPLFIFDVNILKALKDPRDARVVFLHHRLQQLKTEFRKLGSDLWVICGDPEKVFLDLSKKHQIDAVYLNHDYEPTAIERDEKIKRLCEKKGIGFQSFKDQVIFEKDEVLTDARKPYTVYSPYKKKWLASLSPFYLKSYPTEKYLKNLRKTKENSSMPKLSEMGFEEFEIDFLPPSELKKNILKTYSEKRDFPAQDGTSKLGMHLRFGTISVRKLAREALDHSPVWLSELIWREFFMQILYHFPRVVKESFRPEYDKVAWRKSKADFEKWAQGQTGYPLVDAGMRELNATGYMHNRVRMVTASFLTKHLLMHWSVGEKYFASKLLDYELASNNGNWQWAAGTGCDAAPYFRIFNPEAQLKKFDPDLKYVRKWVPEYGTDRYPEPMVDHREARDRALRAFYQALKGKNK